MKKLTLLTLLLLSFAACTTVDYESPRLVVRERQHQSVAVLPFVMVFTGKAPANFTVPEIERIEEAESLAFQAAFYDRLLNRSSVQRSNRILIDLQPIAVTNGLLAERGIGVRESWEMSPESLAEILGVDAVVRTAVHKNRYMSDVASFGVDIGLAVLHEVTEGHVGPWIPPGLTRTHDIRVDSMLCDGSDGEVLWRVAVDRATDWHRPANDVIAGLTRKLAKKFPYRA